MAHHHQVFLAPLLLALRLLLLLPLLLLHLPLLLLLLLMLLLAPTLLQRLQLCSWVASPSHCSRSANRIHRLAVARLGAPRVDEARALARVGASRVDEARSEPLLVTLWQVRGHQSWLSLDPLRRHVILDAQAAQPLSQSLLVEAETPMARRITHLARRITHQARLVEACATLMQEWRQLPQ